MARPCSLGERLEQEGWHHANNNLQKNVARRKCSKYTESMTDRGRKKRDTPHDLESTEMIGFGVHSWINLVVKQRVIHDTKNPKSCLGFLWKNTIGNTLDRGRRDNERKQN